MTTATPDLLAPGERRRSEALLGGRPVRGATVAELAAVARHVIDHPALDGGDRLRGILRELRGAHRAAWELFGREVLVAAATRVEPPGCRWDLLRARLRVARRDEPRRSRALELLLGQPCAACESRLAAREADARLLAAARTAAGVSPARANAPAARGGGRAPRPGPGGARPAPPRSPPSCWRGERSSPPRSSA